MSLDTTDIPAIIQALNQTGGLPLKVTSVVTSDWMQYYASTFLSLIGLFFIILLLWQSYIAPEISSLYLQFALRKFTKITKRGVIVMKHTSTALFAESMIDSNTLQSIERAIERFKGKPFDIVLHTPGGVVFYTQLLAKIIKENKNPVRCFVPYYAMSGGTMLALSCSEIYMGDFACLGPVDPQIGSLFGYGSAQSWQEVIKKKGRRAGDSAIQYAFMGKQYTKTIKENLRYALNDKITDPIKMESVLDFLTSGSIEHGYQIAPLRLEEFGVHIKKIAPELQKILSHVINKSWIEGVYFVRI